MALFLDSLAREDLAPATLRGYRYDLRHFLAWRATVQPDTIALDQFHEPTHDIACNTLPCTFTRMGLPPPV
jgi:hypothetical protein